MSRRPARFAGVTLLAVFTGACASRQPPVSPGSGPSAPAPLPAAPAPTASRDGMASWYGGGDGFDGKPTASGEIYDSSQLTAAHRDLPLGTVVDVTNVDNGRSVRVRINDRGPFLRGRILDVSQEAARRLGMIGPGVARVHLEIVSLADAPPAPTAGAWVVQLGSFADPAHAAAQATRARATGRDVFLEPYAGLTRVKAGPFSTRAEAETALTELEAAGFEGIVLSK